MPKIFASILAATLAAPCTAAPALTTQVSVASAAAAKPAPVTFRFDSQLGPARQGHPSLSVSLGLKEGKPLEMMVWGGGGAIAGSLAGPLGAIIGAGVGAICGLLYSIMIVPHNGPERRSGRDHVPQPL